MAFLEKCGHVPRYGTFSYLGTISRVQNHVKQPGDVSGEVPIIPYGVREFTAFEVRGRPVVDGSAHGSYRPFRYTEQFRIVTRRRGGEGVKS